MAMRREIVGTATGILVITAATSSGPSSETLPAPNPLSATR